MHRKLTTTSLRENKIGGAPYAANRAVALTSKMFSLAIRWGMRADNPAKGIERNPEHPRQRYLSGDELRRLTAALATHPSQPAANAIRLMLLTGARSRREVLRATWDQFEPLEAGNWKRPSSTTKRNDHPVPLSAPARQLLAEMRRTAADSPYLFRGRFGRRPDGRPRELVEIDLPGCRSARSAAARSAAHLRLDPGFRRVVIAGDRRLARPHQPEHDAALRAPVR
jgi:hypothetical protein